MPKISVNGVHLNYVDRGSGDVLLLIHNVVANITTYEQNIAVLEKHFRVIACDLRGHGETTHHNEEEGAKEFYTFDNIAEDITQLLAHLKVDRFSILGTVSGRCGHGGSTPIGSAGRFSPRPRRLAPPSPRSIVSSSPTRTRLRSCT